MAEIQTDFGTVSVPDDSIGVTKQVYNSEEMILQQGKPGKLIAYLKPQCVNLITAGTLVIAETDKSGVRYVCRVSKLGGGDKFVGDMWSEYRKYSLVKTTLDPVYELVGNNGTLEISQPRFHPANWKPVRLPNGEELKSILELPTHGAPLGFACAPGGNYLIQHSIYRHPLHDKANGYVGYFVVGKQGRGKTTLARLIAKSFSEFEDPPAIVVLDGEGEFLGLTEQNPELDKQEKAILRKLKLESVCNRVKIHKISTCKDANRTLSARALRGDDIPSFLPELPEKTKLELESMCVELYKDWQREQNAPLTFSNVIQAIQRRLFFAAIHPSQKSAIRRALRSVPLHLFDQPEISPLNPEELLTPGVIHVVSDIGLDLKDQSLVGLYLLLTLGKLKIDERRDDVGLVLIIDELTRRVPSKFEDPYVHKRVVSKLREMLKVGRKRKCMPVLLTQHPSDVPKQLMELSGVQVVFQTSVSGSVSWLKPDLRPYARLIDSLRVGEALVSSVVHRHPIYLRIPRSPVKERGNNENRN
jgi:hypothetical protein